MCIYLVYSIDQGKIGAFTLEVTEKNKEEVRKIFKTLLSSNPAFPDKMITFHQQNANQSYTSFSMILALLQPTFAPNLYDLAAIIQADKVVLQDVEQWSRKGRVHRALIRTPDGTQYINIPVRTDDRKKAIRDVRIDQEEDWVTPLLRSLRYNYRNSLYFDFYEPEIQADFNEGRDYEYLLPFVLYLRSRLFRFLEMDIRKKEVLASDLSGYSSDPDQLAAQMSAVTLFQEHDSRHYQRQADMRIDPNFVHPEYRQHFDGFESWCCLYDLLFQYGPESFRILDQL